MLIDFDIPVEVTIHSLIDASPKSCLIEQVKEYAERTSPTETFPAVTAFRVLEKIRPLMNENGD